MSRGNALWVARSRFGMVASWQQEGCFGNGLGVRGVRASRAVGRSGVQGIGRSGRSGASGASGRRGVGLDGLGGGLDGLGGGLDGLGGGLDGLGVGLDGLGGGRRRAGRRAGRAGGGRRQPAGISEPLPLRPASVSTTRRRLCSVYTPFMCRRPQASLNQCLDDNAYKSLRGLAGCGKGPASRIT